MEDVLDFLNSITINNNRQWFQEHKEMYLKAQSYINKMAENLIIGISKFDSSIKNIGIKDCTYRIYRDIRFSPDKRPYKTHIGIYVCPQGKKSGLAGYYLHFEGDKSDYLGGNSLYTGLYNPDNNSLKSIREDICYDGDSFQNAIKKAKNFKLDYSNSLTRTPKGFPANHPHDNLLRLRQYNLIQSVHESLLYDKHLIEWTLEEFKSSYDFNQLLNKAVLFSREN